MTIDSKVGIAEDALPFRFLFVEYGVDVLVAIHRIGFVLLAEQTPFVVEARAHDVFGDVVLQCARDVAHADVDKVARDVVENDVKVDGHELVFQVVVDVKVGGKLWLEVATNLARDQKHNREHGHERESVAVPRVCVAIVFEQPLVAVEVQVVKQLLQRHFAVRVGRWVSLSLCVFSGR